MSSDTHMTESSPHTLAEVLETRHEEIVDRWTERLREGLAPEGLTQVELEDHIGDYLWQMAAVLHRQEARGDASVPDWSPVAREHGGQRLRVGFDVRSLVREYHALRECILDLVEETGVRVTLGEVRALTAFITTSIAEGVAEYTRQRDAASQRGEERLRALLEQAPTSIYAKDTQGRYLFSNRHHQQLMGRSLEEMVGRDDSAFFPQELVDTLWANDAQVLAGRTCAFEEVVDTPTGPRTFLSVKFPLVGAEGQPTALGGISTDITLHTQAEAERTRLLRESEERFRLLVETVEDYAIYMLDPEGRVISWNTGAERIKGYRAEEVLGQPFSLFYTPEDMARGWPERCLQAAATHGHCRSEGLRVRKDGQRFWADAVVTALRDEHGVLRGFSDVTRDISKRKRAEQALRETTQRLQAILETAVDSIITIDERGVIQGVNPATQRVFGYTPEEVIGRNISMLMPAPYQAEHDGYMANYLRTGVRKVIGIGREVRGRRKDGSVFPMELAVSELLLPQGRLFTGLVRDISVRKRAEQTQAFFIEAGTLLSQSLDVPSTLRKLATLAVTHLADYCIVDLLGEDGQLHRQVVADRDPAREELILRAMPYPPRMGSQSPLILALERGEAVAVETTPEWLDAAARDAEHRALLDQLGPKSAIIVPLVARGRKLGIINLVWTRSHATSVAVDLEVAKGLADRAAVAIDNALLYQQAQEAVRVREDVVAIVSHDLRNPLNAISLSATTVLRREDVDERTLKAASRIHAAAERASGMIRDLLDFTQARMGSIPIHRRPLDFHEHVQRLVDEVRLAWPERRIDFQASGDGRGAWDAGRLAQVVTNLVGNALQHSPEDTPVQVSTRGEGESVLLAVHNEGAPIPAELLPVLFEPYRQGPEAGAGRGSLGLGLFITRKIVLGHGGTLDVRSSAEEGTTFSVRLPRHRD
ncbi:PAS domain S-box protein [Archangium sp.]|uniref:PAS domain S-box protein n=1 Tax=Archangium sp. TaxID=1872627 RepID=UPI002EDA1A7F